MTFMIKKKRYKFQVDLCIDELNEVSYSKAILLAKVRQLDGGSFCDVSKRMEVINHRVKYNAHFTFPCKMNANLTSGVLETAKCRISIRMEERGGRNFRKIGFTDINMAEYAGSGPSTQRFILQPYDMSHRLDNSILQVTLNITLKEGDTIFQRPLTRHQPILLPGEEEPMSSSAAVTSSAIGPRHIAKKSSGSGDSLVPPKNNLTIPILGSEGILKDESRDAASHTRNSSTASQASQASVGYLSQNSQAGHSRQSSLGDVTASVTPHTSASAAAVLDHGRTASQSSADTGFFGSMKTEKHRQKKLDGRVDAEAVIDELMKSVELDKVGHDDDGENSGLQLYVAKDGSVTFDKSSSGKDYKQVVIEGAPR